MAAAAWAWAIAELDSIVHRKSLSPMAVFYCQYVSHIQKQE
jgi:hypothetical protein